MNQIKYFDMAFIRMFREFNEWKALEKSFVYEMFFIWMPVRYASKYIL